MADVSRCEPFSPKTKSCNFHPPMKHQEEIVIEGARENNLQNIDVRIPKNQLTVITGVSGSGKSSLAFDTLYAEGQRRYLDTFSSYARQVIGTLEKPDVDSITGLSPVISIEQKTTGWNPRSTVGTVTELYDFMRLLYARIGIAYSYETGKKMVSYTEDQIIQFLLRKHDKAKIIVLAPVVRGRKGHYRELFEQYRRIGYVKMRVDGELVDLEPGYRLDRYKTHDIEVVVDKLSVTPSKPNRLKQAVHTALDIGKGLMFAWLVEEDQIVTFSQQLMDPESGLSYETPSPNTFSFNSPYGYCPKCKGLGNLVEADINKIIPDRELSIAKGGLAPLGEERDNWNFKQLRKIAKQFKFSFATPINKIPDDAIELILYGADESNDKIKIPESDWEYTYTIATDGLVGMLEGWYENSSSERMRDWAEQYMSLSICPECEGTRLKKEANHFRVGDLSIGELVQMNLSSLHTWFIELPKKLNKTQLKIGHEIINEIIQRTDFLIEVGLNYLTLNRPARTLSGGESQRMRLATQVGSKLTGITYILDEPTIGLHARDNNRLLHALRGLTDIGNTVVVVEHDKDLMRAADYLIDIGPGAGIKGGRVCVQGRWQDIQSVRSETVDYLSDKLRIETPTHRRQGNGYFIELIGATGHNLKNVNLSLPLGQFICVTGVSGSGKSTLIHETLYPILRNHLYNTVKNPLPYKKITGLEHIDKIIEIDQKPIGRTPRSNPATYTGVFTAIRQLFADVPESKIRGYKPGRFSFNVKGGRCEVCGGAGMRVIEMNFLPDVHVDCEQCLGRRYNRETLEILYKGKNINDVLQMSVADAAHFFEHIPKIYRHLQTIVDVGLGYITLGQQATTLSGGEAQRVKLAEELSKRDTGNTFYILDEPTTGLHFSDITYLLKVMNMLVDKGNTVLVIEHNMDIIKCADYIIDLGPEGGDDGGEIVAQGTPEQVVKVKKSYTAQYLKAEL